MANVITAGNSSNGGTAITTDTSGTLNIVTGSGSGSNAITIDASQNVAVNGNMSFNSGYGSAAVAYGCRAWVNFNGTGTVAIRASGNVTSITDNGTGNYTINFTNELPDVNYCINAVGGVAGSGAGGVFISAQTSDTTRGTQSTSSCQITCVNNSSSAVDTAYINVAIFR